MNGRKTISLGLVLTILIGLVALSFSSCSRTEAPSVTPTKSWSERFREIGDIWNDPGSFVGSYGEQYNVPIETLTVYSYSEFWTRYDPSSTISITPQLIYLQEFNSVFPIERVKMIDENTVVVVYKLEMDYEALDREIALAYVVFKRKVAELTEEHGLDKVGSYESWKKNGEIYFVSKNLSKAAFSNVKVGDSLPSVIAVDPAVLFDGDKAHRTESIISFTTYRILSDGMMLIEFEAPLNSSGHSPGLSDYKVTKKTFYPYGEASSPEGVSLSLNQIASLMK